MKKLFTKALFCFSAVMAMTVCSCSMLETTQIPDEETDIIKDTQVYRIHVGLHGAGADTRLSYQEAIVDGKNVMKTLWSEGDALTANPNPGSTDNAYTFNIINGIGTGNGVFECTEFPDDVRPDNYKTNAWTIYYPGSIKGEQDYFDMTYTGQTQNGNGSTAHLEDYHSLRLGIEGTVTFDDSYINLSGEDLDESMCMKFNLSGLPSGIIPTRIELTNVASDGTPIDLFYTHNYLTTWWKGATPHDTKTKTMTLDLAGFTETSSVTAYMMLSNASITVKGDSKLKVTVTASNGSRYYCEKPIGADVTLKGGTMNSITCTSWTKAIDGFDDPANGIVVLQEATSGNGTDIVIMGDGFDATHFGASGDYRTIMTQAYNDLFSVEPFMTLKPYFNVYYINAVSEEDHDAKPYKDAHGNQNGATQGKASTRFNTQFTEGATTITGDNDLAKKYAAQAIKSKGGPGGTEYDEKAAITRAGKALIMVMVNVKCHAGTCSMAWTEDTQNDYGNAYSVAYTALGNTAEQRRWTTIHEAGGHGFGKLADEYGGMTITSFNTQEWSNLDNWHNYGVNRNVSMYWGEEETGWDPVLNDEYTTKENVYWSDLFTDDTDDLYAERVEEEGLGVFRGAFTYDNLYCRPTENSVMRNQFGTNGQFFNAASRWAIWYRLMRLTDPTSSDQFKDFKDSLEEFIAFDKTINITMSEPQTKGSDIGISDENFIPTAPPVLILGHWENGVFVEDKR